MNLAVFSFQRHEKRFFDDSNRKFHLHIAYHETSLSERTAILAVGFTAVCVFVNDQITAGVVKKLAEGGTRLLALRCSGYDNVDLAAAEKEGITVIRLPAYGANAVAEYTVGLILCLERRIHKAWLRVREDNFNLSGLLGNDLSGRTVGVIGTGHIGGLVAASFRAGFGCNVIANDVVEDFGLINLGIQYVSLDGLLRNADIICLNCPLTPRTRHLINAETLEITKPGVVIANTGRGGLIDTEALVDLLEQGHVGGAALDVYENEKQLFFQDLSEEVVPDHIFQRLVALPNVVVTAHQAFLSNQAMEVIADVTLSNIARFGKGEKIEETFMVSLTNGKK